MDLNALIVAATATNIEYHDINKQIINEPSVYMRHDIPFENMLHICASHHLLNISVQLANKRRLKKKICVKSGLRNVEANSKFLKTPG
jgi:hypothetical protein